MQDSLEKQIWKADLEKKRSPSGIIILNKKHTAPLCAPPEEEWTVLSTSSLQPDLAAGAGNIFIFLRLSFFKWKANVRWCPQCLKSLTLSTVTQISVTQSQSTEVHLSQLMREELTMVWSRLESGRGPASRKPRGHSTRESLLLSGPHSCSLCSIHLSSPSLISLSFSFFMWVIPAACTPVYTFSSWGHSLTFCPHY